MSQFYRILKAAPFRDPWESHGNKIQTWFVQLEGVEQSVQVNKQVGNTLAPDNQIYGDLTVKPGKEYLVYKSAQVPQGVTAPASAAPAVEAQPTRSGYVADMSAIVPDWFRPFANQMNYIEKKLRELVDDPEPGVTKTEDIPTANAQEEIPDEPVTAGQIDTATDQQMRDLFGDE